MGEQILLDFRVCGLKSQVRCGGALTKPALALPLMSSFRKGRYGDIPVDGVAENAKRLERGEAFPLLEND